VRLPADAFAQQFALAKQVEGLQAKLAQAQGEAKSLHEQLLSARKDAKADLGDAIDALDAEVVAIGGIFDAPNHYNAWTQAPAGTDNFYFLERSLDALMQAVDGGADAAPSPDAHAGYSALSAKLGVAMRQWDSLRTSELAEVDAKLKAAGQKTVSLEEETRH
jgi:hypothetical protein